MEKGGKSVNKSFLLKGIYKEVLKEECTDDELSSLSTFISSIKNKMIPLEKWENLKGPVDKAGRIARKYEQYQVARTRGICCSILTIC